MDQQMRPETRAWWRQRWAEQEAARADRALPMSSQRGEPNAVPYKRKCNPKTHNSGGRRHGIDWSAQLPELFTGTNSEAARVLGVSRRAIQDTRARWRATAEEMGLV
jgi:hypothetical protein